MTRLAYVDASAIVKLVVAEAESMAFLRWFVEADRVTTSTVGLIETRRAAARRAHEAAHREYILSEFEVLALSEDVAARSAAAEPPSLRALDAIHLASALALGPELDAFVTYDDRLADAARRVGLPVVRPA